MALLAVQCSDTLDILAVYTELNRLKQKIVAAA